MLHIAFYVLYIVSYSCTYMLYVNLAVVYCIIAYCISLLATKYHHGLINKINQSISLAYFSRVESFDHVGHDPRRSVFEPNFCVEDSFKVN